MKKNMLILIILAAFFSCTDLVDELDNVGIDSDVVEDSLQNIGIKDSVDIQEDSIDVNEPVSEWNGHFYTQQEVEIWRQRAQSGPYKSEGDVAPNSPGEWKLILSNANSLVSNPTGQVWIPENNLPVKKGEIPPNEEGIKVEDAGFAYLITKESKYRDAVVKAFLAQIDVKLTDFSYSAKWQHNIMYDVGPGFIICEWLVRYLHAFDYIKDDISQSDRSKIEAWIKNAAAFFHVELKEMSQSKYFDNVNAGTLNGNSNWIQLRDSYTHIGGYQNRTISIHFNNRKATMAKFVGLAGVYFNKLDWINNAKYYFQNTLRYSIYPDGTCSEMHRGFGNTGNPESGWLYTGAVIDDFIAVADALARTGDTSLYDFTTSDGYGALAGGNKNILLVMTAYGKYVNRDWIRYANADKVDRNIIDGKTNGEWYGTHETWMCQANIYFNNEYIKGLYTDINFPSNPMSGAYSYRGTGKTLPGKLFMYSQMAGRINPYPNVSHK